MIISSIKLMILKKTFLYNYTNEIIDIRGILEVEKKSNFCSIIMFALCLKSTTMLIRWAH